MCLDQGSEDLLKSLAELQITIWLVLEFIWSSGEGGGKKAEVG